MSKHPIDELFKKHLGHLAEEYPQHLWQGVADRLGKKKRPKRALWLRWTTLGVLLLLAGSAGWYWYPEGDAHNILAVDESARYEPGWMSKGDDFGDANVQDENGSQTIAEDDHSIRNASLASSGDEENTSGSAGKKSSFKNSRSNDLNESSRKGAVDLRQVGALRTNTKQQKENNTAVKEATASKTPTSDIMAVNSAEDAGIEEGEESSLKSKTGLSLTERAVSGMGSRSVISPVRLEGTETGITYPLLDKKDERLMRRHLMQDLGYGKNRMVLKWGIAGVYSVDFAVRQLTNRSPDGLALLNYRNEHERFVNAFSTGFEVSLQWHRISVITGLIYSRVNEEYAFVEDNSERIIDGVVVQGRYERRIINRFSSYELPIIVQYEMNKGRWVLGAGVGLHIGLHYATSGSIFNDESLTAVDIQSDEGDVYRDRLSAAPVVSMLAGYKLGYRSMVFLRPSVRHYLDSLTKDEYALDQRQQILSLTAGIRYTIN